MGELDSRDGIQRSRRLSPAFCLKFVTPPALYTCGALASCQAPPPWRTLAAELARATVSHASPPLVVVGASAGGVEAVTTVVGPLLPDFPAAVAVVVHVTPTSVSALPEILSRAGPLPAAHAVHGEPFRRGRIYVAPPDHHLTVGDGTLRLSRGPRENGFRPAVDALFRSAAAVLGARVVGVVLSGALDDGTAGLSAVKRRGGIAIVQEPRTAAFADMPQSALDHVDVDFRLPVERIGLTLSRVAARLARRRAPTTEALAMKNDPSRQPDPAIPHQLDRDGKRVPFSCPECGGALWELDDRGVVVFRCHVGHAFGPESLSQSQWEATERALWSAARLFQERELLHKRLAARARESGSERLAKRFDEASRDAQAHESSIRTLLKIAAVKTGPPREKKNGRGGNGKSDKSEKSEGA